MLCLSTHSLAGCGRPANQDSGCHYHPTAFWAASWFDFDNLCYQTSSFFPGSFQASGGIAPYCLHFCLLQASHWHHCHLQASHWQMMNFAQAPQELLALRACAFCWAATLLVVEWLPLALEGIHPPSHPGTATPCGHQTPSHHPWSKEHTNQSQFPPSTIDSSTTQGDQSGLLDWLPQNKQAKTATCLLQASWNQHKSRGKHNRVWTEMAADAHIQFCKKTISMICTPNFTFFISSQKLFYLSNHMLFYLSNHRNYSIYLITKISLSI